MNSPAPKKIMMVYNRMNLGGIQVKIIDLLDVLSKNKNVEVILVLRRVKGVFAPQIPKSKNIHLIPFNTGKGLFGAVHFFWKLRRAINQHGPDALLTFADHISSLSLLARMTTKRDTPLIVSEEILLTPYLKQQRLGALRKLAVRLLYPQATRIIAMTQALKDDLIKNFKISHQKITVVNNWISPRFISMLKKNKEKSTKDLEVLYVGRLEPQKNLELFIEVIKNLRETFPNIKAGIVGAGTQTAYLKKTARERGLNDSINFFGPRIDTAFFYRRAKVFLLTSLFEGQPLVMLQAMYAKVPVVSKAFIGSAETIISGRNGFRGNNAAELTEYVKQLLKDQKLRQKIGKEASKQARMLYSPRNLERLISLVFSEIPH